MSKPVTLKFVFANKDGVSVEHSTDLEALVSDVKTSLLSAWPEGPSVASLLWVGHQARTRHPDLSRLRIRPVELSMEYQRWRAWCMVWSAHPDERGETNAPRAPSEGKRVCRTPTSGIAQVEGPSSIRLICMGHGILADNKTLGDCKVPVFTTHPTPVNVAIRPPDVELPRSQSKSGGGGGTRSPVDENATSTTCSCVVQ
jgi:hypothetical protein